jgi:hypothetical protein
MAGFVTAFKALSLEVQTDLVGRNREPCCACLAAD